MARHKGDIDDEDVVQWLGPGHIGQISEHPQRRVKKRNPIGFIWPKPKARAKPVAKARRR